MSKTIGIFCAGQAGDCLTISSVLKYREQLWGDCKIVWYIADENRDLLKYQDIELRTFPRGFGYPELVKEHGGEWQDWQPLVTAENRLNERGKENYPSLADIDIGYFPAPHQMTPQQRHGMEYPNISKKVFGVPQNWAWHPVLAFSPKELDDTSEFMHDRYLLPSIAIETFAGSGQSVLSDAQVRRSMEICKEVLGDCNFVFVSNKYLRGTNEQFPEDLLNGEKNFFAGHFTVRQCALVVELCDLLISVSSGITVASSCWDNNEIPILQFCGSEICSTRAMALGRFELVTHDNKPLHVAQEEYYERLKVLLNEIK